MNFVITENLKKLVKQSRLTSKIAITNRFMEIIRNTILKNTPESYIKKQMIELYTLVGCNLNAHHRNII